MTDERIYEQAVEVFNSEIDGLTAVRDNLDKSFIELINLCRKTYEQNGKLVIVGVGKSGHIGLKIAATLSSTGSPAVFLHPVEAMHGDLGVIGEKDTVLALSYSGETDELLAVLPAARRFGVPIVGITGYPDSTLSKWTDLMVPMKVPAEACPFNLAPTASTTALLALGDALAIVLLENRGFAKEDYARLHPAGAIGKSVTLKVADVMRGIDRIPFVKPDQPIQEALMTMTRLKSGSVAVVDNDHKLLGIFTDGDFRRHITVNKKLLEESIRDYMTEDPVTVTEDTMAVSLLSLVEDRHIDDVIVVDAGRVVKGLVDIQDLPKFKLI